MAHTPSCALKHNAHALRFQTYVLFKMYRSPRGGARAASVRGDLRICGLADGGQIPALVLLPHPKDIQKHLMHANAVHPHASTEPEHAMFPSASGSYRRPRPSGGTMPGRIHTSRPSTHSASRSVSSRTNTIPGGSGGTELAASLEHRVGRIRDRCKLLGASAVLSQPVPLRRLIKEIRMAVFSTTSQAPAVLSHTMSI